MLEYQGFLILWALFYIADHITPVGIRTRRLRKLRVIAWVFMALAVLSIIMNPYVRAAYVNGYDSSLAARG